MSRWLLPPLAIAALFGGVRLGMRLDAPGAVRQAHILYVPPGPYLVVTASGFRSVLADSLYLWVIQYASDETLKGQERYLGNVFDAITDLDPRFDDAYVTGAFLVATDGKDTLAALRLLDKGYDRRHNYMFPYDAGFYAFMYLKDYARAGAYFAKASEHPDCPIYVRRLALKMVALRSPREAYDLYQQELRDFESRHRPEEIEGDKQKWRHARFLRVRLAELQTSLEAAELERLLREMTEAGVPAARSLSDLRSWAFARGRHPELLPGGGDPWVDAFGAPYVIAGGGVTSAAGVEERLETVP